MRKTHSYQLDKLPYTFEYPRDSASPVIHGHSENCIVPPKVNYCINSLLQYPCYRCVSFSKKPPQVSANPSQILKETIHIQGPCERTCFFFFYNDLGPNNYQTLVPLLKALRTSYCFVTISTFEQQHSIHTYFTLLSYFHFICFPLYCTL